MLDKNSDGFEGVSGIHDNAFGMASDDNIALLIVVPTLAILVVSSLLAAALAYTCTKYFNVRYQLQDMPA